MSQRRIYLSIGSNLGERLYFLTTAFENLERILDERQISTIYETEPMHLTNQPRFLNAVVSGFSDLSPFRFLDLIQEIESESGRNRKEEVVKGPRSLDIDILLYGDLVIKTDRLVLPHRMIEKRQFVLRPLLELEPEIKNPLTGIPYSIISGKLPDQGVRVFQ